MVMFCEEIKTTWEGCEIAKEKKERKGSYTRQKNDKQKLRLGGGKN